MRKYTNIEIVEKFNKKHKNKYDYSLVDYKNNATKVKIICTIHGVFDQEPNSHLKGCGCPFCSYDDKKSKNFIINSKKIHNNKYDYLLVNYVNAKTKIKIICKEHGVFEQEPSSHLSGSGCPICFGTHKKSTKIFIEDSIKIHGITYDYSLVEYVNAKTKIKIICKEHGIFEQLPNSHLFGKGCSICGKTQKLSKEIFIEKANEIHTYKYDYSLVNYLNTNKKVKIICPTHGVFEQLPNNHINKKCECPKCSNTTKRIKAIYRLEINRFNGNQMKPNFNKKACELFDKISEENNVKIQHAMNGGEYYIKELGYWLDGYDAENNIAYEFDEKAHKYKLNKDVIRQLEIEKYLGCKFIRKDINKI